MSDRVVLVGFDRVWYPHGKVLAVFSSWKKAKAYVEKARLKKPVNIRSRGPADPHPKRLFKRDSLLEDCYKYNIRPWNWPYNPEL